MLLNNTNDLLPLFNQGIERITGVQLENGKRTYLVHWKTSTPYCTWLAEENLCDFKEPVQCFLTSLFTSFILENTEIRPKIKKRKKHRHHAPVPNLPTGSLGYHSHEQTEQNNVPYENNGIDLEPKNEVIEISDEATSSLASRGNKSNTSREASIEEQRENSITPISSVPISNTIKNFSSNFLSLSNLLNDVQPSFSNIDITPSISRPELSTSPINFLAQASLTDVQDTAKLSNLSSTNNTNTILNLGALFSDANLPLQETSSTTSTDSSKTKKQYICWICNQSFHSNSGLMRHVRIHTGIRPFHCSYCPKTFTRKDHQISHERVHTGDKPYLCEICGQLFKTGSDRNRHIQMKHNTDPPNQESEQLSELYGPLLNRLKQEPEAKSPGTENNQEETSEVAIENPNSDNSD